MKNLVNISYCSIVILLMFIPFLSSCHKEWQDPNTSIPSKELTIRNILVTPSIYDGAGVIIEGKVWDLLMEDSKNGKGKYKYTTFKLADEDGNYINIRSRSDLPPVTEGEIVKVVGMYKLSHDPKTNEITSQVEAYRIEK